MSKILYCGMDVHKDTVMVAVLPEGAKEPTKIVQLMHDERKLKRWFARLADEGEIRACYEASGAGYVLQRQMSEWGHACEIIAPSLIPRRPPLNSFIFSLDIALFRGLNTISQAVVWGLGL